MQSKLVSGIALVGALVAAGCGGGSRCSVADNGDGTATISCDDGTSFRVRNGSDGTDGTDGGDGTDGTDGMDGMDGTSCSVMDNADGSRTISCEDGTSVTIPPDGETPPGLRITGVGLQMEVRSIGVDMDRRPFVELRFTDGDDRPLDREGVFTEGAISVSFTIAHLPVETRVDGDTVLPYQSYLTRSVTSTTSGLTGTQPIADAMGTWTPVDAADGVYRYAYGATLPADYDVTETHLAGIWATRTFDGVRYVANASPTFRPDGMAITETREIVTNDACSTCHTPLAEHGGSRQDVGVCVSCHGRGFTDPDSGSAIDFDRMVHRIHRGASLPSVLNGVPFQIIGRGGDVHDYSTIHFPQDVRNCETCHGGADADLPTLQPSRAACGSCHDDIWFEEGAPPQPWMRLHPGGDRPDDTRCTVCHEATGGLSGITEAHFTKRERPLAQIPAFTIDAVTLTAGRQIQLDFTVTVNGAPRDILTSPLTSLSAIVAGPSTDYLFNASFTLTSASAGTLSALDASMGRFRWVSASTVDTIASTALADPLRTAPGIAASGTWGVGMQATLRVNDAPTATACTGTSTTTCSAAALPEGASWQCVASRCTPAYTYPAVNPVAYLAITDAAPVERREVVSLANCTSCHEQLELHGGGRNAPEFCVMCHNSTFDTADRMPIPVGGSAHTYSLSFAGFIHRVHTGEDGASPAVYWGPRPGGSPIYTGGNPVDFGEVRFPADREECETCHVEEATAYDFTHMLDLRPVRTRTLSDTRSIIDTYTVGPITAACTGCHDDDSTAAHAATMTSALGDEACVTCHGPGEAFGADLVHTRPEYDWR